MIPLFSEAGRRKLDEIVGPGLLCVFDFDGTLTPIVARPERAYLTPEVTERLVALCELTTVAVLTGRSVTDIRTRLPFSPDYLVGNHGSEGLPGWEARHAGFRLESARWRDALAAALESDARYGGAWIEDKLYSLSVHYPGGDLKVRDALLALFERETAEARIVAGKSVFNLVPADAPHKGDALQRLIEISGAERAIYVGDDVTDEDAFRVSRPGLISVRIEPLAQTAADFYLPQCVDIMQLLDDLLRRLRAAHAAKVRLA
jgi:trehalose 6-phosphate phosphatase